MSKIKIGKIYNKSIVAGDKNLVTSNEIHKSELSGGNNSNNTGTAGASLKFYKFKNYNVSEEIGNWVFKSCAYWAVTTENSMSGSLKLWGPNKRYNHFNDGNDIISLKGFAISFDCLALDEYDDTFIYFNDNIKDLVVEISIDEFSSILREY